ncbi:MULTISPECIES: flavocytochrome c [unclassified Oceanispirochaeta]|uniref:flavocytochrome c n=1 Tax=unclassified Oceanispirochaeta TaxID=2635722 RepID=UPI000E098D90|nr:MULTISPECIES: flavocytochrome c [unclassified Oceanispirochaeta]MBF9016013.1 flavocytochrome c [Oceanispirochaeta sp. M2]NPD72476.1 flavocytochrome c [Oceanispirochaeta sp. M1]RDG31935.1 flavocytochrome c [Oceanispirochaeta sp. M1]
MRGLTAAFLIILSVFIIVISPGHLPERTDVVIIGAGAAGMRAAIESRKYTDNIILLEKMSYPGGNSNKATAGFNAVMDTDDLDDYIQDTREAGGYIGNSSLIKILGEKSSEALSDLKAMGADMEDRGLLAGHSSSRTYRPSGGSPVGREISSILYKTVRENEIDIRVENRALSITRSKKKLQVLVKNQTGREYRILADSVIIATGGFGGSPEMVARFNPDLKTFHTTNSAGATGDFITLTQNLPVQMIDLGEIQTHPTVEPEFSILITEALRGNGGILLNSRGQRFTDEMDFREELSASILNQKDRFAWLIFDQSVRESLKSSEYYISNQLTREGETVGELAEQIVLPASFLSSSLEKWNLSVLNGEDKDFHRRDLRVPLETPPYFAIKVTPGIHYCMGGLAIDEKSRVLDTNGTPLEGLYAAGEATGGIHGMDRLGGNSLTDALVFGEIAGYEAAHYALK